MIARREEFLTQYQNAAYAQQYRSFVDRCGQGNSGQTGLRKAGNAVARYLFKLMAYKDEYEVARLFTDGSFEKRVKPRHSRAATKSGITWHRRCSPNATLKPGTC
jgi:indolepyruvate ferredoxin oxidoreductase